jgi:A/G-specific adenine glycosylase
MARVTKSNILEFQKILHDWYQIHGRTFPWRDDMLTSYEYVISEVLLQRTRAETVANFYGEFIATFPSWKALHSADIHFIEQHLKAIGLQKQRAYRLKQLAAEMVRRGGVFPTSRDELESIPFLGQYIANAIELLVNSQPRPLLDVNMARVLERYFGRRTMADLRYDPYLQKLAQSIIEHQASKLLNWAILDFAAAICRPRPRCEICMLRKKCTYFKTLRN